jgi:hypothetical protein
MKPTLFPNAEGGWTEGEPPIGTDRVIVLGAGWSCEAVRQFHDTDEKVWTWKLLYLPDPESPWNPDWFWTLPSPTLLLPASSSIRAARCCREVQG